MNIFERAKNVLLNPKREWEIIKSENLSVSQMFTQYAAILAAIPAIAGFIGYAIIGMGVGFGQGTFTVPIGTGITYAILNYVLSLAGVFVVGLIIDFLAPSFGSSKNMADSIKVVAFAYTASWVGGIFMIIPALSIISSLAGIYSLVLLYMGLKTVKNPPADKVTVYFIVVLIAAIIVFFIIGAITSGIVFGSYAMSGQL